MAPELLQDVKAGGALTLDRKERTVLAVIGLGEMYQRAGSTEWISRGRKSQLIVLAGEVLLARIPAAEGGSPVWLRLHPCTLSRSSSVPRRLPADVRQFYRGGDALAQWGPARKFAKQEQSGEVRYTLLGTEWQVADLGAFHASVAGECEWVKSGDHLYFVTSRSVQQREWLWYLDARPGEAQGSGGVFRGVPFDPAVDVEAVL